MCTLVVSIEPGAPVLLAGIRDEMVDRAWQPPGRHWPDDYPGLIGGRDLLAGGTWLAVAPGARRVACVLNGRGRMAPAASRQSRGVLPLEMAAHGTLAKVELAGMDPFHLVRAEPGQATWWSWDGERLSERDLPPGLHMLVNSGLGTGPPSTPVPPSVPGLPSVPVPPNVPEPSSVRAGGQAQGGGQAQAGQQPSGRDHERARAAHFLPRLRAAARPLPLPGLPVHQAWGSWLPLLDGGGLSPADPRALIIAHRVTGGRVWGSTSVSLVAVGPGWVRYDFTATPGDPSAWYPVTVTGQA